MSPRVRKNPIETLTEEECERLIAAAGGRSPTGIRNRALVVLLWRGALRVAEALALEPRDIDFKRGEVRVRRGKGCKSRTIGLDPMALGIVTKWRDRRTKERIRRGPFLCTIKRGRAGGFGKTKAGKPLEQPNVHTTLRRLAEKAGIDKRVHAHGLRHSRAWQMARNGVPIPDIRDHLGHSSYMVTDLYVNHELGSPQAVEAGKVQDWGLGETVDSVLSEAGLPEKMASLLKGTRDAEVEALKAQNQMLVERMARMEALIADRLAL